MERLHERVAGLDVHKASVMACVRVPGPRGTRVAEVHTFGTTTPELLALRDWLMAHQVTQVAMESTGVYWKPVYYVLEETVRCLLVNAAQVKQVPGRKTDVQDCVWIAQLLEHGLLRGSFVPPAPIREVRDLTRYRTSLTYDRTREANRLHKLLEDAGLKLATVATDILGVSGRAMLTALVDGTTDPAVLAELARGRLRQKLPALRAALTGRFRPHHALLLTHLLAHLDYLDESMAHLSTEIEARLAPFASQMAHLDSIDGVGQRTAEVLLAELGPDMSVFPNEHHLASWAGLCPGNDRSAGKRRSGKIRKGTRWLRQALTEASLGALRTTDSALAARYRRIKTRGGHKVAIVAVAHAILRISYRILADGVPYQNPGPHYLDQHHAVRARRQAIRALERQGFKVILEPVA